MRWAAYYSIVALVLGGCDKRSTQVVTPDEIVEPPRWHYQRIEHGLGDLTLSSLWARSDGAVFAVGTAGTIITNRITLDNPDALWLPMVSGTTENLTAIIGVENGAQFGVPDADGEMLAVGWHGTLIHYNPNPDGDAETEDGFWQVVTAPAVSSFAGKTRIDPACPDYDGDGFADDGDGDGFAGNAPCAGGSTLRCDDNCRGAANGSQRPLSVNDDGCVAMNASEPASTTWQVDVDGDGIGKLCDNDDTVPDTVTGLKTDLMAITAQWSGSVLDVVAVGTDGAVVTFHGPSAAATSATANNSILNSAAWLAQKTVAYRFDDDCADGTAAGSTCENGRLPPACPAQCSPRRTTCDCPVGQGQCCDTSASTGVGCADGSCGAAPNACDGAGTCSTFCPNCQRQNEQTLRGVALNGDSIVVIGAAGTILEGSLTDPSLTWNAPTCTPMPKPFDDYPVLNAVHGGGGGVIVSGASGALAYYAGGHCPFTTIASNTLGVINAVHVTGGGAYAVGDQGLLLQIQGDIVTELEPDVDERFFAITTTYVEGFERLWIVGAGGVLVTAAYY